MAATALMVLAALAAPTASAKKRITCTSGQTVYKVGKLRIFSVHVIIPGGVEGTWFGDEEYYCYRSGKPQRFAGDGADQGTGSETTYAYAYDGRRYLAFEQGSDGEGGPDAYYEVLDLKTGKVVHYQNLAFNSDEPSPPFLVSGGGVLVSLDDNGNLYWVAPGKRQEELRVSKATAADPAVAGNTLYWLEPGDPAGTPAVHSTQLPGPAGAPEARALRPVRFHAKRDRCVSRRGRTVAAAPDVRVLIDRDGDGAVCRVKGGSTPLPWAPVNAGAIQITRNRWVLARDGAGGLAVVDSKRTAVVTTVDSGVTQATLLDDGTVAWSAEDGSLSQQSPGKAPERLAPAGTAPSALASSHNTVYWTAGGTAHAE